MLTIQLVLVSESLGMNPFSLQSFEVQDALLGLQLTDEDTAAQRSYHVSNGWPTGTALGCVKRCMCSQAIGPQGSSLPMALHSLPRPICSFLLFHLWKHCQLPLHS